MFAMKNAFVLLWVALLATGAQAVYVSGFQRGYKNGDEATRINEGGASDVKTKNLARKNVLAKAKTITVRKLEIPEDATYYRLAIDHSVRILSLCGFEIGTIAKVPNRLVLDADGNIVMTGKLKKPFRTCTSYEVKYSKVNHALYSIRVFSPAQKKMDDEAAAELEAMAAALKTKFEGKVLSWLKLSQQRWTAQMKAYAHQSLTVNSFKDHIYKKSALKGTAESLAKGWAFSVTLTDRAMHDYLPATSTNEDAAVPAPADIDAL